MKKLFVCSEFYAGLLPFGANIVNAMRGDDCFGIFVCTPQCDYRRSVFPNSDNYTFLDFPDKKLRKLQRYIYPHHLMKTINQVVKDQQIEVVHLLTEDTSLAFFLPMLQRRTKVFYTVHDLFAHEKVYKNTLIRLLRKVLVEYRVNYIIRRSHNLVTCSYAQYELMKSIFPNKNVCFHNFPSLITASVKSGNTVIPELHGITDYLLFFGQVEQYKGVHILYNTYLRYADEIKRPLVIAGKGHIYFKREVAKEGQVIFINRYIADEEIKCLFSQAYCSIFPYISGTQSGILSLPYFFKIPSIVSDIPFFESMTVNNVTSLSFGLNDPASLVKRINELDDLSIEELKNSGYLYYEKNYDSKALRSQLVEIYHPQSG